MTTGEDVTRSPFVRLVSALEGNVEVPIAGQPHSGFKEMSLVEDVAMESVLEMMLATMNLFFGSMMRDCEVLTLRR